jgi:Ni,Fe-hydrogenase III small subunit
MSVEELIRALEKMPKHKIVVLTESDGIIWDNIGQVIEDGSTVKITMDGNHPFED